MVRGSKKAAISKSEKTVSKTDQGKNLKYSEFFSMLQKQFPLAQAEVRLFAELVGTGPGLRERLKERNWNDFRYDFSVPEKKIFIEVQGFGFGHSSAKQQQRDYKKNNDAVKQGWRVMFFPANIIKTYPHVVIDDILEAVPEWY